MGLYLSVIAMIWRLCDFITSVCVHIRQKMRTEIGWSDALLIVGANVHGKTHTQNCTSTIVFTSIHLLLNLKQKQRLKRKTDVIH